MLVFTGEVLRVWPGVPHQHHPGTGLQHLRQADRQRWVTYTFSFFWPRYMWKWAGKPIRLESLDYSNRIFQFCLHTVPARISSSLQAVRKKCPWHDVVTWPTGIQPQNVQINKMHAYHSMVGLAYPEGLRSNGINTLESQIFFPSPFPPSASLCICLLPLFFTL